jgi:hypothetical protein
METTRAVPEANHANIFYRCGRNGARRRHTFAVDKKKTLANRAVPSDDDAQVI